MNETTKLELTKDSFLYSVNQAYEARRHQDGYFHSHLKYIPFLEKTWECPKNPDVNSFKHTLSEIIAHHSTTLPHYRREESVNLENIAWFSHSIAALFADIEYLAMAYTGHGFPILSTAKIPRTNSSKAIAVAIKKYSEWKNQSLESEKFLLLPLIDDSHKNLDEQYTQEFWSLIFYFAKKSFGIYSELASLYATWKYLIKETKVEAIDWNVRPPCGEDYRKQFKHLFEKDYGRNNGKKNLPGKKELFQKPNFTQTLTDENGAQELPQKQFNHQISDKEGPQQKTEFEPAYKKRHEKNEKNRSRNLKDTSNKPLYHERKERQYSEKEQLEQEENLKNALDEATQAIKKMQKNSSIEAIPLSPQNSFIRRQQHVIISEAGFETESQGENESRCVCIKRKLQ